MKKIFISYRRQDTRQIAGRIFDKLAAKFGHEGVFMDTEGIPFGVDFHEWLDTEVSSASIVLVLIGHGWAEAVDSAGQRRLDSPDDFVRIEIEAALRRGIPLGAVLIDGATMPRPEQLPDSLRSLTRRNAAHVDVLRDFHPHMDRLIADLERHLYGRISALGGFGPEEQRSLIKMHFANELYGNAHGRIKIDAAIVDNPQGYWFLPGAGKTESFRDLAEGPEMVVVPAGHFIMGSPEDQPQRAGDEGPQHEVNIPRPFAIGRYAVTRGQFAAFVQESGHMMGSAAFVWNGTDWIHDPSKSWRNPGFAQDDAHPVVCVNWNDAQAYANWLSWRTGKLYRLPSEAEWEYACRAGTATPFWWGASITPDQANYDGNHIYEGGGKQGEWRQSTVQVSSFLANPWGLYQVHGNVWEWCEDRWHNSYVGAPADGSAWIIGDGGLRVLRGGSWSNRPLILRAACRNGDVPDDRDFISGFRLSRTLNP